MNLYELSNRYQQLLDQDELTEEDCAELDSLYTDAEDQCLSRGKYIRNKQAELDAVTAARKEMQEREKALTAKIERNEQWLANRMMEFNLTKITKSPLFPMRVKQNPVSVDDFDKTAIPDGYWRIKVTESRLVDKVAIKDAIESGADVPGARLVRTLKVEFK